MLPGLRLLLLPLCVAGCAAQLLVVPDADWQTVPANTRASVDHQHEVDLAAARTELAAATAGLAELRRVQDGTRAGAAPTIGRTDADADEWQVVIRDHEQARVAAFARVGTARVEAARADLAWRELRVEVAEARLAMVSSERELRRAQTIDRNLLGTDHYDVAPLRGQFSRTQQRWHAVATQARQARITLERASTTLASAKEAYAQLMRNGPAQLGIAAPPPPGDERARLELSTWAVSRDDIARRRGLRHFLDTTAATPPQLRKKPFRLSPAPRTPPREVAAPPAPAPLVAAPAPAPPAPSPKPWDTTEPAAGRAGAAKPAASPKAWDSVEPAGAAPRKLATAPRSEAPAAEAPTAATGPQPMGPALPPGGLPAKPARTNARATRPAERTPAPASVAKPVQAPVAPAPQPR